MQNCKLQPSFYDSHRWFTPFRLFVRVRFPRTPTTHIFPYGKIGGARFAVSRYSRTFPVRRVSALSWKGTRKSSRARARGRSTRPRRNEGPLTMRTFFYVRLQYFFNLSARDVSGPSFRLGR